MKKEELSKLQDRIPPKEYNRLLNEIELESLYMSEASATANKSDWEDEATLDLKEKASLIEIKDNRAKMKVDYTLLAKSGEATILKVNVTYIVNFAFKGEVTEDFFELYSVYSLPIQTYPFFREYVNSTVSKMDLPQLWLPLRKYLVAEKVATS